MPLTEKINKIINMLMTFFRVLILSKVWLSINEVLSPNRRLNRKLAYARELEGLKF